MDFIETVRSQVDLPDAETARFASAAVLEALGGRIAGGNVEALAADLPGPLAAALRRGSDGEAHAGGTLELTAKAQELLDAAGDDQPKVEADGLDVVVAVLRAVATTVDRDVVDRLGAQLPADLTQLLVAEEEGDTSSLHSSLGGS